MNAGLQSYVSVRAKEIFMPQIQTNKQPVTQITIADAEPDHQVEALSAMTERLRPLLAHKEQPVRRRRTAKELRLQQFRKSELPKRMWLAAIDSQRFAPPQASRLRRRWASWQPHLINCVIDLAASYRPNGPDLLLQAPTGGILVMRIF